MKKIYSILTVALSFGLVNSGQAQITVSMTDAGPITLECGLEHTFEDDGGGGYSPNFNDTLTVCPDGIQGSKITVRINADTENWQIHESDTLYIYDGPDVNSPLMGAFNLATDTNGIVRTASFDNPSGCLTFVFISDGSNEGEFVGVIQCGFPCQPFTPYIASSPASDPGFPDTGYVDICLGDTIWMWAQAEFPHSSANGGIGYLQTLQNSTYEWELADGTTFSGVDSIMVIPSIQAGYGVQVVVTDTLGCPSAGYNKIRVSTTPNFSEIFSLSDDTICPNETAILVGGITTSDTSGVAPVEGNFLNGGVFTGLTYLPDGSGVEYETTIEISGFDSGQVVMDPSDILDVCLTIEHSYLGDLEMSLTCPDGTEINIFNSWTGEGISPAFAGGFGGGATYLGDAFDNNQGTPGVGWEYCFSDLATWGTLGDEFGLGNTTTTTISNGNAMTPGTYLPEESFNSFLGCPINGEWTITVRDNIGTDDGYIFEWGILFNPDVNPNVEQYNFALDSAWWDPDASIINVIGDTTIEVQPPTPGDWPYTLNVIDEKGCVYDTTVNVHVVPALTSFDDFQICSTTGQLIAADYGIQGEWTWINDTSAATVTFDPDEFAFDPEITASEAGPYQFVYTSEYCAQSDTVVAFFNAFPEPITWTDEIVCIGDDIELDAGNTGLLVNFDWNPGNFGHAFNIDSITETTEVTVTVSNDCGSEDGSVTLSINAISASSDSLIGCDQTIGLIGTNLLDLNGTWSYETQTEGSADFSSSANILDPNVQVSEYGFYDFIYTEEQCGYEDMVTVEFFEDPEIASLLFDTEESDTLICFKDTTSFDAGEFPGVTSWQWVYTSALDTNFTGFESSEQVVTAPHEGAYAITASGPCGSTEKVVFLSEYDCGVIIPSIFNTQSEILDNSYFKIPNLQFHPGNEVHIYDRWGLQVFERVEYQEGPWRGINNSTGIYYWTLILPQIGETHTGYVQLINE